MKVLVVVDMQKDFVTGALGSEEARKIIPNIKEKMEKYKENKDKILFTMDTHNEDYLETLEGKYLPVRHCIKNTDGWHIIPELDDEKVPKIWKYTFGYMNWDLFIPEDVEEIELCGVCTDICVVSNALILRAMFPNTKITVDAKACAGVTPEKHEDALSVMKSCQIDVIN